jgi:hypothetical protein
MILGTADTSAYFWTICDGTHEMSLYNLAVGELHS